MLRVLQSAFGTAFGSRFTFGAPVTFVVTDSDITVLNIGGPFWGIVAGVAVSLSLERGDFRSSRGAASTTSS